MVAAAHVLVITVVALVLLLLLMMLMLMMSGATRRAYPYPYPSAHHAQVSAAGVLRVLLLLFVALGVDQRLEGVCLGFVVVGVRVVMVVMMVVVVRGSVNLVQVGRGGVVEGVVVVVVVMMMVVVDGIAYDLRVDRLKDRDGDGDGDGVGVVGERRERYLRVGGRCVVVVVMVMGVRRRVQMAMGGVMEQWVVRVCSDRLVARHGGVGVWRERVVGRRRKDGDHAGVRELVVIGRHGKGAQVGWMRQWVFRRSWLSFGSG